MFVFRPILNTSAEYANFHFPAQHQYTLVAIIDMILVIFFCAIPANLFVLYLSFFSPQVTGYVKYFVANLALCDLCYNLSMCFQACSQMYHDFMNVPYTATSCYATFIFPYVFAGSMLGFALPLTAANRYVFIVMERGDWFTKRRVFLLCICSYLPLTWLLVDFLFAPYVSDFVACDFIIYTPYIIEVCDALSIKLASTVRFITIGLQAFLFEILLVGMPLMGFWSLRVYQILSEHISVVSARLNKKPEQIREEKSILKAIVIQALIPLICVIPAAYFLIMMVLYGWNSPEANLIIFSYGKNQEYHYTTLHLSLTIVSMFPIIDPFVTLCVVKSYQRAADQFLAKFKIYRKFIATTQEEAYVPSLGVDHSAPPSNLFQRTNLHRIPQP